MENEKIIRAAQKSIRLKRMKVYGVLAERFGTNASFPSSASSDLDKINFSVDRLFTVIHEN